MKINDLSSSRYAQWTQRNPYGATSSFGPLSWGNFNTKPEGEMSDDPNYYPEEYHKYKSQLMELEKAGKGTDKTAGQLRGMIIKIWNKLTPKQQTQMATKYLAD